MSGRGTVEESDHIRFIEYPDFELLVWKSHPAVKKGIDFDAIASALPDLKQAVVDAAEFMLRSETKSLLYDVTILSELNDIKLKLFFPLIKGKGVEAKSSGKKRMVRVDIHDIWTHKEGEEPTDQHFASVLGWDLGQRFECVG